MNGGSHQQLMMPPLTSQSSDGWTAAASVYDTVLQPSSDETMLSISASPMTTLNHPALTVYLRKKLPSGVDGWAQLSMSVMWDWSFTLAQIVFGPSDEMREIRLKLIGQVPALLKSHEHQVPSHKHPEISSSSLAPGCTVLDKNLKVVPVEAAIVEASMDYDNKYDYISNGGLLSSAYPTTASVHMKMYPDSTGMLAQIPAGQLVKGLIFEAKPVSSPKSLSEHPALAVKPGQVPKSFSTASVAALPKVSKKDFTNGVFYVKQMPDPPIVGVAHKELSGEWLVWVGEGVISGNVGGWAVLQEPPSNPMTVALTVKAKKNWKSSFAPKITATFPDGTTQSKNWSSALSDPVGDVHTWKSALASIHADLLTSDQPVFWQGSHVGKVEQVAKLKDPVAVEATIQVTDPDKIMKDIAAKFGFTDGATITYTPKDAALTKAAYDATLPVPEGMKVVLNYTDTPLNQLEPEGSECEDGMAYYDEKAKSTQVWLNGDVHDVPGKPYDVMWLKH